MSKEGARLLRGCRRSVFSPARALRVEPLEERQMLSVNAADAINQFGLDVYAHMQREQGNLFFSPLSLSTGLAMTSLGAAGQTASEMQQVLHLGSDPVVHASYRELLVSALVRTFTVEGFELQVANAIWPGQAYPAKEGFIDAIETNYFGHVEEVDFSNPALAEDTINSWVASQTAGQIEDLVSGLSTQTLMVLTNTVYFNALWDIQFHETNFEPFNREPGDTVSVAMMYGQPEAARTQIDGFDVLEIPFVDREASMVLIMPEVAGGSNVVSEELLVGIDDWLETEPETWKMVVKMPRFQTTVETNLNQFLIDLGMPSAFDPGSADFSGMFDAEGAAIKEVFHKATIEVTEQGTEAAADTEVEIFLCFAAGTPVLTPDGPKAIEELRSGDIVLARDEHNLEAALEPKVVEETRQGDAAVLELTVGGRVIRTTDLHPFFVRGAGWTPAGKLQKGDRLATNGVDWVEVDSVGQTGASVPVFNLRVADHHTYFIGDADWEFAVWTHNFYDDGFYADRPFHLMIRDNETDTLAFMGRIDDPTQLDNEVVPVVEATSLPGDYDFNGVVDQSDYDVWRDAYGQTGAGLAADGNGDGVVNAADYTLWRNHLEPAPPQSAVQAEESELAPDPAAGAPLVASVSTAPSARPARLRVRMSFVPPISDDALLLLATTPSTTVVSQLDDPEVLVGLDTPDIDRSFESLGSEAAGRQRSVFVPALRF